MIACEIHILIGKNVTWGEEENGFEKKELNEQFKEKSFVPKAGVYVPYGNSINLMTRQEVNSTWISFNRPLNSSETNAETEHAGFLMALGLNGHLSKLRYMDINKDVCQTPNVLDSVNVRLFILIPQMFDFCKAFDITLESGSAKSSIRQTIKSNRIMLQIRTNYNLKNIPIRQ